MGLQQLLDPSAKKAVEVQQDCAGDSMTTKKSPTIRPEAGAEARERGSSPNVREGSNDNEI